MTLTVHTVAFYNGPPPPTAAALIERYAAEGLALHCAPTTARIYIALLHETLAKTGEAGLLTAPTTVAQLAFRTSGRPQDRYKAQKIGAILDDFREWAAGH